MRLLSLAACLLILSSCQDWPDPVIRSVTPSEMVASEATTLAIDTRLPLPMGVDYATGEIEADTRVTLTVGTLTAPTLTVLDISPQGVITARVPSELAEGSYDVKLELGDGRTAELPGGLTVVQGQWPDGYSFDPIAQKQRLAPFTVTVRATGANAASFRGTVRFGASAGATIRPRVSDPFVDGVLTQEVVVDSASSNVIISVSDIDGNRGTSNEFVLQ